MSAIYDYAAELWQQMRSDYQDYLEAQLAAAQRDLGPYLVRRGSTVDAESLFTGPSARAATHASPELLEWWERHGRMTVSDFEKHWITTRTGGPTP